MQRHTDMMIEIREKQLTLGIRCVAFLGVFVLIASLSRAFYLGWHKVGIILCIFISGLTY